MELSRRKLLGGLFLAAAAPAIVRASSLMPVKALEPEWAVIRPAWIGIWNQRFYAVWQRALLDAEMRAIDAGMDPRVAAPDGLKVYVETPRRDLLAV